MKVIFRLDAKGQYLAFFLKAGELTHYIGGQESSCSNQFFHRTLHLTDLHRLCQPFKDFMVEVTKTYGFLEIKHSLGGLQGG